MCHRVVRTVTAIILAAGALVLTSGSGATAAPATARPRVSLLGDSTMAAVARYGTDAILRERFDVNLNAVSCRRIATVSCGRTYQPPNVVDEMRHGHLGDALVIMAGYDD